MPPKLPPSCNIQHYIDFSTNATLSNLPYYKLNLKEQQILKEIVEELLQKELIQPSLSPCVVPAFLVQKKNGSWRMCFDSITINKITIKYSFPVSLFEDILDHLADIIKS